MAATVTLGSRTTTGALDTTGLNSGNLTNSFTSRVLAVNTSYCELYHMIVQNVPSGASATIYLNNKPWGFVYPLNGSEWDPQQPMVLHPGDQVDFCWTAANGTTPLPQVTAWLRYDPSLEQVFGLT